MPHPNPQAGPAPADPSQMGATLGATMAGASPWGMPSPNAAPQPGAQPGSTGSPTQPQPQGGGMPPQAQQMMQLIQSAASDAQKTNQEGSGQHGAGIQTQQTPQGGLMNVLMLAAKAMAGGG